MWTNIRLRNFRLFEDTGALELAPLTFFIGPNSGGKSTLLKALLLLKQSAENVDLRTPITPNGNYCELGRYEDYVFRAKTNRNLGIGVECGALLFKRAITMGFEVEWSLNRRRDLTLTERVAYYRNQELMVEARKSQAGGYCLHSDQHPIRQGKVAIPELRKWYGVLDEIQLVEKEPGFSSIIEALENNFASQLRNTFYLSALRYPPQAVYRVPQYSPADVGLWGERTADLLYTHKEVRDDVCHWMQSTKLGGGMAIKNLGKTHYSILIDDAAGQRNNLISVGFGVPQCLPILAQGLAMKTGATLLLEQPEIHLNPAIQSGLGDFFAHLVKNPRHRKQLIIETHSEHILNRVRTWMVQGKLTPEQVAVYYCDLLSAGGKVRRLRLTELGKFQNWPRGFFNEELTEALKQTQLIFKRKKKEARKAS